MEDSRFSRLLKDPRFVRPKKKQSKVSIDNRFKEMFTDEQFTGKSACKVDKFGRLISEKEAAQNSTNAVKSLKRFYNLEEENFDPKNISSKENDDGESVANGGVPMCQESIHSSNSSSEDEQEHSYSCNPAAIDHETITIGDATARLAFVNLDWDNIQAQDIYQLAYSFKPPLGQILSAKIYYSSFGKERIAQESLYGPPSNIFKPLDPNKDKEDYSQNYSESDEEVPVVAEEEEEEVFYSGSDAEGILHDVTSDFEEQEEEEETFKDIDTSLPNGADAGDGDLTGESDCGQNELLPCVASREARETNTLSNQADDTANVVSYDSSDLFVTEKTSEDFDEEALRKYQLERLRYCFAIVETDSVETAEAIYSGCDGQEFEKTCNILDIRYVPDGQEFCEKDIIIKGGVSTSPIDKYSPIDFTTLSLMHSKVSLTWDANDLRRSKLTKARFSQDALDDMDFKAYLASSDDEGSEEEEEEQGTENHCGHKKEKSIKEILSVYKKLANSQSQTNPYNVKSAKNLFEDEKGEMFDVGKEASDIDMEMTFLQEDDQDDLEKEKVVETVFQSQLRKEKEKRDQKRAKRKGLHADHVAASKEDKSLSLLVDEHNDSDGENAHFNMDKIMKRERDLLKKKHHKNESIPKDSFQIQLDDPRFADIYSAYEYSIDPSHPGFKNTSSMRKLLASKRAKQPKIDPR